MSDQQGGPDWIHASDGKWYPRSAYGQASNQKRHWLKWSLIGVGGFFAFLLFVGMIGAVAGSDDTNGSASKKTAPSSTTLAAGQAVASSTTLAPGGLYPTRVDRQREDQERVIGQPVNVSGYTATLNTAGFQRTVSDYEKDGYIAIDVSIENRDSRAQSYNPYDWKLQWPSGQVKDLSFVSVDTLDAGDLVKGGKVSGKVYFEVGDTKGDYYVIYKPDPFDAARGIWKVTL